MLLTERINSYDPKLPIVVSYGGGTDSTALLIECHKLNIRPDLILFADTGGEKPHTYEYIKTFSKWLVSKGMPEILTIKRNTRIRKTESLYDECIRSKTLPSIAYGYKRCSLKHKVEPQDKYVNNWIAAKDCWKNGNKVIKLIGYNASEPRRAKITENEKYWYHYPLIELDITKEYCKEIILNAGLTLPGKSACFFCPSSKKSEILELQKNYPDLLEKALEIEKNAACNLRSVKGLGRRFSWTELINDQPKALLLAEIQDESLPCGCYDGE